MVKKEKPHRTEDAPNFLQVFDSSLIQSSATTGSLPFEPPINDFAL